MTEITGRVEHLLQARFFAALYYVKLAFIGRFSDIDLESAMVPRLKNRSWRLI
jgi:hypothetical protein